MGNSPKTARSRREGALPDGRRLTAAIAECEAVLAIGRLPDPIGHGDAFGRLLRLLRELGPPEAQPV